MSRKKVLPCGCTSDKPHLTHRQIAVLTLIARGFSSATIAQLLVIEVCTVDRHIQIMLRRSDTTNRLQLTAKCFALGILLPGISLGNWEPRWSGRRCLEPNYQARLTIWREGKDRS